MRSLVRKLSAAIVISLVILIGCGSPVLAQTLHAKFKKCDYCSCDATAPMQVSIPAGSVSIKIHILGWSPSNFAGYPLWVSYNGFERNKSGWTGWSYPLAAVSENRIEAVRTKLTPEKPNPGDEVWFEEEDIASEPIVIQVMISSESFHDGSGACHQGESEHWFTIETGGTTGQGDKPTVPTPASSGGVNLALHKPATQSSVYANNQDYGPQVGVDGVESDQYAAGFFHTNLEDAPWWQVDLQGTNQLREIRLFNRTQSNPERANHIQVKLSMNGRDWETVYNHNGTTWNRLSINVAGKSARFVRVQLPEQNYLHLDEVEVYGSDGSDIGGNRRPPDNPVQIYNNWNVDACDYTNTVRFTLREPVYVSKATIWFDWSSTNSVSYTLTASGRTIRSGSLLRGDCSPGTTWCDGNIVLGDMEPGVYRMSVLPARVCQNAGSGGNGFIKLFGNARRRPEK